MARVGLETISAVRPQHWDSLRLSLISPSSLAKIDVQRAKAAIEWIKRAQNATGTGGVSWGYRARAAVRSGERLGWQSAYPETSGYIVETLLRFSSLFPDLDAVERAHRIADWEVSIQLKDGGFQGGVIGSEPVESSTFVTGQVLFGLVRAHQTFGGEVYRKAALRAMDFLIASLDESGGFSKGYSKFCAPGVKAYEVRTGWALALAGKTFDVAAAVEGGRKTAEFALQCQRDNGWFENCDMDYHDSPLTHTIAYTLEGLFELGALLGEERFWRGVRTTLNAIRPLLRSDGFLAGRWTSDWRPAADWCCLTGSCQLACVCFRMHPHYPAERFDQLGERLLRFVASTQQLDHPNPALRGSIHGSQPFNGDYGQYCNLNWAAKFFVDAVLDWMALPHRST
jgi:hypothetical protein